MATNRYLALTAAEFATADPFPANCAWMACHFSPAGSGLSNLPVSLPAGSLLMLNDSLPFRGHDAVRIAGQLRRAVEALECAGVVLDFQRPVTEEFLQLTHTLISSLPCPTALSDLYAAEVSCPVFLSPCPHHVPLAEHLQPWHGREIWLDLARDARNISVTKDGCQILPLPPGDLPPGGHLEENLHCHYSMAVSQEEILFTLWRTPEDLDGLAGQAEKLGVHTIVSLYQELQMHCAP